MMRLKSKYTLFIILMVPFAVSAQDRPAVMPVKHEFSLQQTVDYALKNNATVKNALLDVKVQQGSLHLPLIRILMQALVLLTIRLLPHRYCPILFRLLLTRCLLIKG
jgi:hypothetical protein